MYSQKIYDVIVIGGGASGLMAAYWAAKNHQSVVILEKNASIGKKLAITGGSRCNITNNESDVRTFLSYYGKSAPYLFSPFSQFGVNDTITFFTNLGLPLITERLGRMFPQSQRASDVVALFKKILIHSGVIIETNCCVTNIVRKNDSIAELETSKGNYIGKSIILATGGISHPETGSTGDGFSWLASLGHSVAKPTPTIVPIAVKESWIKKNAGKKIENCKYTIYHNQIKQFSKSGSILLTHFGLSGPLILNSAATIQLLLTTGKVTGTIDLFPLEDEGTLSKRVVSYFDANKNKQIKTVLKELLPPGLGTSIELLLPALAMDTPIHSVPREQRKALIKLVKALPFTVTKLMGEDRAVAADGGVNLSEIDMRTMRSKKITNLFITGDLLNINRPSGGYSLQLCWTTGYIAGIHA